MEKIMKIPCKTVDTASLIQKTHIVWRDQPMNHIKSPFNMFQLSSRQDTTAEAMEHKKADFASGLSAPKCRMPSTKTTHGV